MKTRILSISLLLSGLALGIAQTINPTDGGPRPGSASLEGIQVTRPLMPEQAPAEDPGFVIVDAITQAGGPVADPNLNDVPSLDQQGLAIVTTGAEQSDNKLRIRPIFSTGALYDDNIYISNTDRQADVIFNVSGGFALEVGDYRTLQENYLLLEYIGSGYFFTKNTNQNSFGQDASVLAQYRFNQLAVQFESQYQYINGAQRQVGGFATRNLINTDLRFIYDYSDKVTFDLELSQDSNIYESPYNSSYFFQATAGMDYRLLPKLRVGLEGTAGYVTAQNNPNQTYEIINARAKYDLSGKVAIKATGGVQLTQYNDSSEAMRVSPVFSIGGEYLPFANTTISLTAYRNFQVSPSFNDQNYWATGVELGVKQTIAQRFQIGIAGGYENDTYVASTSNTVADRVDNFLYIQPEVSYNFLKYLTASVFYQHRFNDSTQQTYTWYDNQVGFELSAAF